MSNPFRAVRTAQSFAPTAPKVAVRTLHITGAQAQPSTALAFQSRVAELRKSGERWLATIDVTDSIAILSYSPGRGHRYSTVAVRSIILTSASVQSKFPSARPFNTTRALQHPHDFSPIDMVYMPSMPSEPAPSDFGLIPILPDTAPTARAQDPLLVSTDEVVKPEISTTSRVPEGTIMALSETDGGKEADEIGMVEKVGEEVEKGVSGARKVWEGFVDDLLGPRKVAV